MKYVSVGMWGNLLRQVDLPCLSKGYGSQESPTRVQRVEASQAAQWTAPKLRDGSDFKFNLDQKCIEISNECMDETEGDGEEKSD